MRLLHLYPVKILTRRLFMSSLLNKRVWRIKCLKYNLSASTIVAASGELNGAAAPVARAVAGLCVAEIRPVTVESVKVCLRSEFSHELQLPALVTDLRQVGRLTLARVDLSGDHRCF